MMIDSLTGPGAADQRSANLEGPQMRMQERMSLGGPAGFREDDISKQGSFLSTKHKSENSLNENSFENFVPIIKRMNSEEVIDDCECHPTKKLKYFDISAPKMLYCSKCVIDLVVDKNFNSAMTNKEFQKKKQTEDFLNNLSLLSRDLGKIQDKIYRDIDDLEKNHASQKTFLENLFSQLTVLINESKQKYTSRVDKTFHSIKDIFNEKCAKMAKFDREMKELEKDVRLNYTNIIKLMDLEPFYEIIYRYNKKLNNIKLVFTEFKGKPDEIPEDAIRVKSLKSQMSFVKGFSKKLEHFFVEDDSFDSNNISQEIETDRIEGMNTQRELDIVLLPEIFLESANILKHTCSISTQTEGNISPISGANFIKKLTNASLAPPSNGDELKAQAEMLIKSVDTLIANGEVHMVSQSNLKSTIKSALPNNSQRTSPDSKQSKSISKAEIAKRIQAHFQSGSNIGKVRSVSNSNGKSGAVTVGGMSPLILEKKYTLNKEVDFGTASRDFSSKNRDIKTRNSKEKLPASLQPSQIFLSNVPTQKNYVIPSKNRMQKQHSAGAMPTTVSQDKDMRVENKTLMLSKTERILQIYRKNKNGTENQNN